MKVDKKSMERTTMKPRKGTENNKDKRVCYHYAVATMSIRPYVDLGSDTNLCKKKFIPIWYVKETHLLKMVA